MKIFLKSITWNTAVCITLTVFAGVVNSEATTTAIAAAAEPLSRIDCVRPQRRHRGLEPRIAVSVLRASNSIKFESRSNASHPSKIEVEFDVTSEDSPDLRYLIFSGQHIKLVLDTVPSTISGNAGHVRGLFTMCHGNYNFENEELLCEVNMFTPHPGISGSN